MGIALHEALLNALFHGNLEVSSELRESGETVYLEVAEQIATTIYVFSEEHRIVASGAPDEILSDHDLLHRCNLAHYHTHQRV